jgi:hypothetical protein
MQLFMKRQLRIGVVFFLTAQRLARADVDAEAGG